MTAHKKRTPKKRGKRFLYLGSIGFLLVLAGVVALLTVVRNHRLHSDTSALSKKRDKGPKVDVTEIKNAPSMKQVTLIGEIRPFEEATVYAKLSGYLATLSVDKGDRVRQNQIVGTIESPETNMAYLAAQADAVNKRRIAARMKVLQKQKLVSAQEAEQAYAAADIATSQLRAQKVMKDYEILRAPFDGVVTARYADPGALIQNAQNSQGSSLAVVTVSEVEKLRIYFYIQQQDALEIHPETGVSIWRPERPDLIYDGTIARIADELDPQTRMLLAEIDYDNTRHEFMAGSFVNVQLKIKLPPLLEVPVQAISFQNDKSFLPIIEKSHVHFLPAKIIDDDGVRVRFVAAVPPQTTVALDLGPTVKEGDSVQVQAPQNPPKSESQSQAGAQEGAQAQSSQAPSSDEISQKIVQQDSAAP